MRDGLARLNAVHGTPTGVVDRGYHETITVFFMRRIRRIMEDAGARPFAEVAAAVLVALGEKKHILEYYSRERIMSWEAKRGFVEPDLRAIE